MWYYVAENPWYLAGAFGLLGVGFLLVLKMTQDGRHLIRALIAFGIAAAVLVVEQFLVTDAERIEWVVKDLIHAMAQSDADGVTRLMDDHVTFSIRNDIRADDLDLDWFRDKLKDITFDWVHLSRLTTRGGGQGGQGSAEFKVGAAGTYRLGAVGHNFAGNSEWSLGFRKARSGEWKITRITAMVFPPYVIIPLIRRMGTRPAASVPPPEPAPERKSARDH